MKELSFNTIRTNPVFKPSVGQLTTKYFPYGVKVDTTKTHMFCYIKGKLVSSAAVTNPNHFDFDALFDFIYPDLLKALKLSKVKGVTRYQFNLSQAR